MNICLHQQLESPLCFSVPLMLLYQTLQNITTPCCVLRGSLFLHLYDLLHVCFQSCCRFHLHECFCLMLSDSFGGVTRYMHDLGTSIVTTALLVVKMLLVSDSCATGSLPLVSFYLNFLNCLICIFFVTNYNFGFCKSF